MKCKKIIKPILFLIGLAMLLSIIQPIFMVDDARVFQTVQGFYEEPQNSLDAVYIGASNVYSYWQAPLAWNEFGIKVYPMSIPGMPARTLKYMIEECRKTQPEALYIVSLNSLKDTKYDESKVHYVANHMSMSVNKIRMINDLASNIGITGTEQLEFYLPWIRFHSAWTELSSENFINPLNGMKAASHYSSFLKTGEDISADYRETDQRVFLAEEQKTALEDLLAYCETEQIKVLFVIVPQVIVDETTIAQLNYAADIVQSRGFHVQNLQDQFEKIGLDPSVDFYNGKHANIHGSIKFTHYFGDLLCNTYGLSSKKEDAHYRSWDEAYEKYESVISPYTLDFERDHLARNYMLDVPELSKCTVNGQNNKVTWKKVSGAEEYFVYRRNVDSDGKLTPWSFIAAVDSQTNAYLDKNLALHVNYDYTVVPVCYDGDTVVYGNYDITGIRGKTVLKAPKLLSLSENEFGITITWEPVKRAKGYVIYRKIPGQSWVKLETVTDEHTYTDQYYQSSLPYIYTVRAYASASGANVNGTMDSVGLLRMTDLDAPNVLGQIKDQGKCSISWNSVKGATSYYVYRNTSNTEWEKVDEIAVDEELVFNDNYAEENAVAYRVSAVLKYRDDVYEYTSEQFVINGGEE